MADDGNETTGPSAAQPTEPAPGGPGGGGEELLAFDAAFARVKVEPNPGEENDANFPRNVHNAAELFLRLGIKDNAERLHSSVTKLFQLLEQGPDGRTTHTLGRACICWSCGHAGIPANADNCSEKGTSPAGVCNKCGDSSQTNFLKVTQPDGTVIPWLEFKAHAPAGAPGSKKVQPNAQCPCASGKKAKKCCFSGGAAK